MESYGKHDLSIMWTEERLKEEKARLKKLKDRYLQLRLETSYRKGIERYISFQEAVVKIFSDALADKAGKEG